jgi:hypothetical protein
MPPVNAEPPALNIGSGGEGTSIPEAEPVEVMPKSAEAPAKPNEIIPAPDKLPPGFEDDDINKQVVLGRKQLASNIGIVENKANSLIDSINDSIKVFQGESLPDKLVSAVNEAVKRIAELPGQAGSKAWMEQAYDILRPVQDRIDKAPRKTASDLSNEEALASQRVEKFYKVFGNEKVEVEVFIRQESGGVRYYLRTPGEVDKDITKEINKTYIPLNGKVDVTAPGVPTPSVKRKIMGVSPI